MNLKTILFTIIALVLLAAFVFAEVPQIIAYQGRLLDAIGDPVADGPYLIKFRFYNDPVAGTTLWDSGIRQLETVDGYINYNLGDTSLIPDALFANDTNLWLGIKVGTDPEMTPRSRLASVGHAYHALRADSTEWGGLTNVPAGFADGTDNVDTDWNNLTNVPAGFADGTDNVDTDWNNLTNVPVGFADGTDDVDTDWNNLVNVPAGFADGTDNVDTDWNNLVNVPAGFADNVDDNSGGDITAVTAGAGLTGGGPAGAIALSIAIDGVTSSNILDGTISSDDLDVNSVGSSEIINGSVTSADIANSTITGTDIASNTITAVDIAAGGVATSEILNLTIMNADINSAAAIAVTKISGTAVNLSATQTITGQKQFGDSTIVINNTGVRIGDNGSPTNTVLLYLNRDYNTTSTRYGLYNYINNISTGTMYGVYGAAVRPSGLTAGASTYGVLGRSSSDSYNRYGVYGIGSATNSALTTGESYGIYGVASDGSFAIGVYVSGTSATNSYGGYFVGQVLVTGTLSKGAGSFKIDHPLDPENKYLYHSFVESPDMMNVYNGNVQLDGTGTAVVILPDYFDALNKDFRYQLTAIGAPGPNLYISSKISGNQFMISGGEPGMEVSWMVTGVRQDKFANANRIQVEVAKEGIERGKYLHYEEYNQPLEKAVGGHRTIEENKRIENSINQANDF